MLIWKNHLSLIWLWLWIEWMDDLYFRELLKVFNMRCCKEHLSNTVTETYIRYRLYLCFTEATAVMIHLGYRIKSLQLSFKEECFICVCMKVDFLPVFIFFVFIFFCLFCFFVFVFILINCNMTFQYECIDTVLFLLIQYCILWLKTMKDFCICFSCVFLCCETFICFLEVMIALHQLLIFTHFCV